MFPRGKAVGSVHYSFLPPGHKSYQRMCCMHLDIKRYMRLSFCIFETKSSDEAETARAVRRSGSQSVYLFPSRLSEIVSECFFESWVFLC